MTSVVRAAQQLVQCTVRESIAVVRLNDPARGNLLSRELSDQLAGAVTVAVDSGARVLVLLATAPTFCSGESVEGLLEGDCTPGDVASGIAALADAPIPTIAAVGGAAVGAGVNLPLACDLILASHSARFDPRFLDIGLHPGGGHLWRLGRRIGSQGAFAMVVCGDVLTGQEAVDAGLAWRCVPDSELEELAMLYAERITLRSPELVARTTQSLRDSSEIADVEDAVRLEAEAQRWSMEQPSFTATLHRVRDRRRYAENRGCH